MSYTIYTDGSFNPNSKLGVSAVYIMNHKQGSIQKMMEYKVVKSPTQIEYEAIDHAVQFVMIRKRKEKMEKIKIISDCKPVCDCLNEGRIIKGIDRESMINLLYTIQMLKKEQNLIFELKYLSRNHNLAHHCCYDRLRKVKNFHTRR